ncbi:membrane protein insertase YidC [Lapidilactobacillus mulanensis]|uniref:Membrane protein insertase YidC n=1 Tax=Lapidilactobacillus mulanensis TaxID=2485999 RepID=A0ABW4DNW8_9LACO|nr:membrane protein insertase YidC [Lapidilactobacillus mulanensis]
MKRKQKLIILVSMFAVLLLVLSGCANQYQNLKAPTGFFYGSIYKYLAVPMQKLLLWVGNLIGGVNGYGWGIIVITLVIRLILLPIMLNQVKKSTRQTEKMNAVRPQIDLIQKHRAGASTADAAKYSQLTMEVYQKNNLSMTGAMGCLPMLIQLPIFAALYQAVQFSPMLAKQTFLGVALGKPSLIFAIIATLFYLAQSALSLVGIPAAQRKQMMMMLVLSPGMTFFISIVAPSALALYFLAGGIIILVQQILTTFVIQPRIKAAVDAELKEHPIVTVVDESTFATAESAQDQSVKVESKQLHQDLRARNAGKQKRK